MNEFERAHARARPLPFRLKLGYAAGAGLDGAISHSIGIFLLFYLTTIAGLPGTLAGFALAAGLVVDAIVDPAIGSMSDSWRSRLGRRLPFMMIGFPLVATAYVLLFSVPQGLPTPVLFGYVLALSIMLRVSVSIYNLPFTALTAELTEDYRERSSISTWRWALAVGSTVLALVIGFGVFFKAPLGVNNVAGYTPFAITIATFVSLLALTCIWATHRLRERLHLPTKVDGKLHQRLVGELRECFKNRSFVVLFLSGVLFFSALGSHSSLSLHINTYFWKLAPGQVQMATLSIFVGLVVGAPLAGPMLKRLEKRTVVMIGMSGLALSGSVPAMLRLIGLFPFEGQTLAFMLSAILFTGGVLMAGAAIAYAAMIADATDEHEHVFGTRREGLYNAGWAFAAKCANGAGTLLAGIAVQVSGFQTIKAADGSQVVTDPTSLTMLALLYSLGSLVLYGGAIAMMRSYRLSAERHRAVVTALNDRRAARASIEPSEQAA
jgi:GPH family glycoside/pentoside/hexuronide:cation symporter